MFRPLQLATKASSTLAAIAAENNRQKQRLYRPKRRQFVAVFGDYSRWERRFRQL